MQQQVLVVYQSLLTLFLVVGISKSTSQEDFWSSLSNGYSKNFLPPHAGPIVVELDLYILSLSALSEKTMDFKVNMFLRQRWQDSRLANNASVNLRLTSVIDDLWVPDLFIANDKESRRADVTVINAFLNVDNNGYIVYSQRITSTIACSMDLMLYPFDTQHCKVKFESYGHTTDELVFQWKSSGKAIEVNDDIALPEHSITNKDNIDQINCTVAYSTTGAFSCVGMRFQFDRTTNYYVMSVFVPSVLIVVLSWVSFWIDKESTPGRVSLALLTILTMQTQLGANMSQLPRVSYIKFIDIWLTGCLAFVFAGLLEYALVNKLSTEEKRRKALPTAGGSAVVGKIMPVDPSDITEIDRSTKSGKSNFIGMADRVDHFSRFLFPLTFLVLNIILWAVLYAQKKKSSV